WRAWLDTVSAETPSAGSSRYRGPITDAPSVPCPSPGRTSTAKALNPCSKTVISPPQNAGEALPAAVSGNTCAIVLEPIFGEGGILECSTGFLQECRVVADRHRAALIFDEIQWGVGRP